MKAGAGAAARGLRALPLLLLIPLGLLACASPPQPASAGLIDLSGHDPLKSGCGPGGQDAATSVEPSLDVDPTDPSHLVAAWQQDRHPQGGALAIVASASHDGGRSWRREVVPGLTRCSGGSADLASDPWVSIGADGTTYLSSLVIRAGPEPLYSIVVSRLRKGSEVWEDPVTVRSRGLPELVDKETILADPKTPGRVYAVWVEAAAGADNEELGGGQRVIFSSSSDGGTTWAAARPIHGDGTRSEQGNRLLVRAGTLIDVLSESPARLVDGDRAHVLALRSTDGGATWTEAGSGEPFPLARVADPRQDQAVRAPGFLQGAAAGPDGRIYATWFAAAGGSSEVVVSASADGGVSWSKPVPVSLPGGAAFLPGVAVAGDGSIACLYYQLRSPAPVSGPDTDVWLATSKDRGLHWTRQRVGASFDLASAPLTRFGLFLGDYFGLTGLPHGFAAAFVAARPVSTEGDSVLLFSRSGR